MVQAYICVSVLQPAVKITVRTAQNHAMKLFNYLHDIFVNPVLRTTHTGLTWYIYSDNKLWNMYVSWPLLRLPLYICKRKLIQTSLYCRHTSIWYTSPTSPIIHNVSCLHLGNPRIVSWTACDWYLLCFRLFLFLFSSVLVICLLVGLFGVYFLPKLLSWIISKPFYMIWYKFYMYCINKM